LPEASARLRPEPELLGRPRSGSRRKFAAAVLKRLGATPARGYAAAALTAALVGIVVNALALQHAHHPAPFFIHTPAVASAPAAPSTAPTASATPTAPAAPTPPLRPAQLGGASSPSQADAIAGILRADEEQEAQKRLAAAQGLLVKLGYVVKADGEPGAATITALRDFERAHGLPPSNEVSPRLLKALAAATNATGR